MVSFTPPICSGGWLRKRLVKCSISSRRSGGLVAGGEIGHRFVQVVLVEQEVIGVFQRHICADLAQGLQSGGDVGLRLVLEEAFVDLLAETGSGIDD